MSSVILTNWTVYYASDAGASAGKKQIKWTGTTGTNTVNELYSALMHLFDNPSQNEAADSIPIRAVTPTQYEIGAFDAGDNDPWYMDPVSVTHLTGAGLNSKAWTRVVNFNIGIVKVSYSVGAGAQFVSSDIGRPITYSTDGDAGVLLHYDTTSSTAWIRPDSSAAANNFDASPTANGTLSITGGTGSVTQTAAGVSAESIWANIYTLGTLEPETELTVYQNFSPLTQWWSTGHLDILVLVKDFGTITDSGILTVYARQYSKTYDHSTVTVPTGGRNPVPLATNDDPNNLTGYRTFTAQSATGAGTFNTGNYLYVGTSWSAATAKGIITAVAGTSGAGSTPILTYYLIGNFTDFANGNAVKEYDPITGADGDASCTASAPTDTGPLASPSSTLTISFSGSTHDLNNGLGSAPYSVTLNLLNTITISQLYERAKYLTRTGQITDIDTETSQSLIGQAYIATGDYYLPYDTGSVDNPFTEGETITATGGFSCVLTSKHDQGTSEGFLIVRNVRGTIPVDNTTLTGGTSTHTALIDTNAGADPVATITPIKATPFGTFAGGKFFGARGVWLANVLAADSNNFELVDAEGTRQAPPTSILLTVNGIAINDQVAVFKATGNNNTIDKNMFNIDTTTPGGTTTSVRVEETIPKDTPLTGIIRLVHRNAANRIVSEERLTYSAWNNTDQPAYSTFTVQSFNSTLDDTDTAYVPYLDVTANDTFESVSLVYDVDHYVTCRVRQSGILPFMNNYQLTSSNLTITAVRSTDPNVP